jgi:dipeptidyl aminopeptidase/acylaminoacyl peptidase
LVKRLILEGRGKQLFHALKDNGIPVRFFAYPVGGHFPNDPVRQQDVYRRWTEWLAEHLK